MLGIKEIEAIIPHRHPFLLIDCIEGVVPYSKAVLDEDIEEELEYDNISTLIDEDFIEHNQFLEDEADLDTRLLDSLRGEGDI